MILVLVAFSICGSILAAPQCPSGYVLDSSSTCYSKTIFDGPHYLAYKNCAKDNGFMFDIQNAFQNTNAQSKAQGKSSLWLGLTCLGNTADSCMWDTGRSVSSKDYTNFAKGMPNVDVGACVYMNVKTGLWYSSDCAKTSASSICQLATGVTIDYCRDKSLFFRGKCLQAYFAAKRSSYETCFEYLGGSLASIHSAGENSFVRDVANLIGTSTYTFLEMYYINGTGFHWPDGTVANYQNFGFENISTADSAAMALVDGVVKKGQWVFLDLPASGNINFVCEHAPSTVFGLSSHFNANFDHNPDPPHHSIPVCPGTNVYNTFVKIASPGYPSASPATNCEYVITAVPEQWEQGGHVSLEFVDILLDAKSSITLYNDLDNKPLVLTSTNYHPTTFYSFNKTMKLVFSTPGGGGNFFKAEAASGETIVLPDPSDNCNGGSFYGSGVMRSPNYPYNYPPDIENCEYTLHSSKERIILTFKDIDLTKHDSITILDGNRREIPFPDEQDSISKGPYYNVTFTSYTESLTILFQTSATSKTERGFDAYFYSIN